MGDNVAGMSALSKMFDARSVVVLGASRRRGHIGYNAVLNLTTSGYTGEVHAVNPAGGTGPGNLTYLRSLADVPGTPDLAVVCLPAPKVIDAVRQCAQRGVGSAVVVATDMGEEGGSGVDRARELLAIRDHYGIRILGPNTNGFSIRRANGDNLIASFMGLHRTARDNSSIGIIGQGGGMTVYLGLASLANRGLTPRYLIDTANELDVDAADCMDHMRDHDTISRVGLVLESSRHGRRLCESVLANSRAGIETAVILFGRTTAGMGAANLHTGALATGNLALWQELQASGAFVTGDERDFVAALLDSRTERQAATRPRRAGVLTWSGGFAVHSTDLLSERGIPMAAFGSPPTDHEATALLSRAPANPLDLGGTNPRGSSAMTAEQRFKAALGFVLRQEEVGFLVLFEATVPTRQEVFDEHEPHIIAARTRYDKPIYLCGMVPPETERRLREAGISCFERPSDLAAHLQARGAASVALRELAAGEPTVETGSGAGQQQTGPDSLAGSIVDEAAFELLADASVVAPRSVTIAAAADLEGAAATLGLPLVLKLSDPQLIHKSEHGAVRIEHTVEASRTALAELTEVREKLGLSSAVIVASEFVTGLEMSVGAYVDRALGPVVMAGRGGVEIEVYRDVAFALAPVTPERAVAMLRSLTYWPMLAGKRSVMRPDVGALAALIADVSALIAARSEAYAGIDLNPVMVRPVGQGVVVVDAAITATARDKIGGTTVD